MSERFGGDRARMSSVGTIASVWFEQTGARARAGNGNVAKFYHGAYEDVRRARYCTEREDIEKE